MSVECSMLGRKRKIRISHTLIIYLCCMLSLKISISITLQKRSDIITILHKWFGNSSGKERKPRAVVSPSPPFPYSHSLSSPLLVDLTFFFSFSSPIQFYMLLYLCVMFLFLVDSLVSFLCFFSSSRGSFLCVYVFVVCLLCSVMCVCVFDDNAISVSIFSSPLFSLLYIGSFIVIYCYSISLLPPQ